MAGANQGNHAMRTEIGQVEERGDDGGIVAEANDSGETPVLGIKPAGETDLPLPGNRVMRGRADEHTVVVQGHRGAVLESLLRGDVHPHPIRPCTRPDDPLRIGDVDIQSEIGEHPGSAVPGCEIETGGIAFPFAFEDPQRLFYRQELAPDLGFEQQRLVRQLDIFVRDGRAPLRAQGIQCPQPGQRDQHQADQQNCQLGRPAFAARTLHVADAIIHLTLNVGTDPAL